MAKLGLNPDLMRSYATSIEAQLGTVEHAQGSLQRATAMSLNPLNFLLSPGALILTPWSITQTTIANTELALARASARELIGKILAETGAQEWASSDLDGLYETGIAWRTADAKNVPDLEITDFFDPLNWVKGLVDGAATLYAWGEGALDAASVWWKENYSKFTKWWKDLPPWAGKLAKWGKLVPIAGSIVSGVDLIIAWNEGDWVGVIRHGGSIVIDIVTAIVAPTGVGAIIGAAVGIGWDLAWTYGENAYEAISDPLPLYEYYQQVPWMAPIHALIPLTTEIWGPLAD